MKVEFVDSPGFDLAEDELLSDRVRFGAEFDDGRTRRPRLEVLALSPFSPSKKASPYIPIQPQTSS